MAKKDQNIMLLQEVVGQLRKLNAGSVRDRLREAEEAKRAEQIALQGDVQEEQQASIVDSTEDFRRRFIAGQAKTFTDRTTGGSAQRDKFRNTTLVDINRNIIEGFYYQTAATEASQVPQAQTPVAQAAAAMEDPFTGLIKVNTDSLVQNLSTLKNINFQILSFLKTSRAEDTKRYNTQQRLQEEARKEAIKLNARTISGAGVGVGVGAGSAASGEMPIPDTGTGPAGTAAAAAAGVASLGLVARMKKWFGFGTKRGFAKTMALRFKILGRKIFRKFKLTGKQVGMLANPRKWPFVLAAVLAGSFLSLSAKGDEGEDTSDSSVLPGELEDLPEQSAFETTMDNTFNALFAGALLSKSKIVQRVATNVGNKVRASYAAAPKNSMKGRLYANAGFRKGLSLTGRGLLRFMGPWGLGAWVVWEISSMIMKSYSANESELLEAREEIIKDYTQETTDLLAPENAEFARLLAPDGRYGSGKFTTQEKRKKAIDRIKALMKGKTADQKALLMEQLADLGWNPDDLASELALPGGNGGANLNSKLEMNEKNRLGLLGPAGMNGGIINSGNSVVGDSITQIHNYIQGYQAAAFEGRKGYMPGQ